MPGNKRRVTFRQIIDRFNIRIQDLKNTRDRSNPQDPNIFRIRAYQDVVREIEASFSLTTLVTINKVERLEITEPMAEKIKKFLTDPTALASLISKRHTIKKSFDIELQKIKGIGKAKAKELTVAGVKSVSDLKKSKYNKLLSDTTRSYIKHNPRTKISRKDIQKIERLTKNIKIKHIYVGSYRRGKEECGDVDILVIGNQNTLSRFKNELEKRGIILWIYTEGKDKISTIAKIPGMTRKIKFDFFRSPSAELATQLLYSTGSADFNQMIRGIAKRKGMLLNQHGLYNISKKSPKKIPTPTEKSIFTKLGIKFREPRYRN